MSVCSTNTRWEVWGGISSKEACLFTKHGARREIRRTNILCVDWGRCTGDSCRLASDKGLYGRSFRDWSPVWGTFVTSNKVLCPFLLVIIYHRMVCFHHGGWGELNKNETSLPMVTDHDFSRSLGSCSVSDRVIRRTGVMAGPCGAG